MPEGTGLSYVQKAVELARRPAPDERDKELLSFCLVNQAACVADDARAASDLELADRLIREAEQQGPLRNPRFGRIYLLRQWGDLIGKQADARAPGAEKQSLQQQSEQKMRSALELALQHLSPGHDDIARSKQALAKRLWNGGKAEEAVALMQSVVDSGSGPKSPVLHRDCIMMLAICLKALQRWGDAEMHFSQVVELAGPAGRAPHRDTALNSQYNVGYCRLMQQKYAEAEVSYRAALDLAHPTMLFGDQRMERIVTELRACLSAQGKQDPVVDELAQWRPAAANLEFSSIEPEEGSYKALPDSVGFFFAMLKTTPPCLVAVKEFPNQDAAAREASAHAPLAHWASHGPHGWAVALAFLTLV
jgi:tetratricopeptide (TPR) repeat protein